MNYAHDEDLDEELEDEESMSKEEKRIQRMRSRQRKLPLLLGGFTLGGFVMGVAYAFYMRKSKKE